MDRVKDDSLVASLDKSNSCEKWGKGDHPLSETDTMILLKNFYIKIKQEQQQMQNHQQAPINHHTDTINNQDDKIE